MSKSNCSQCGNKESKLLKVSDDVMFCKNCLNTFSKMLDEVDSTGSIPIKDKGFLEGITPSKVNKLLDSFVIGQEDAKRKLAVAIYNQSKILNNHSEVEIDKSNILLVGPTGSGKTHLIRSLSKSLGIPLSINDATSLTSSGYVGDDVTNVIRRLIQAANNDIEAAQRGIVFIDEIDKLGRKSENPSITRDVGGEGVQQELLKLVEGSVVDVSMTSTRKNPSAPLISFDTSNVLFIIGGSFEGIEKIIKKRLEKENKSSYGFNNSLNQIHYDKIKKELTYNNFIDHLKVEDLKSFGMIPEFLGRFSFLGVLKELNEEQLIRILKEPKNSLIKQYTSLFKIDNIDIEFKEEFLVEIAKKAIEKGTGARSLKSLLDEVLLDYMYMAEEKNIKSITFNTIEDISIEKIDEIKEVS